MADNKKPRMTNGVKVVKKPLGERLSELFFGGTVKDAKSYVVREVAVPAIKDLIFNSCTGALDKLLNGPNSRTGYGGFNHPVSGGVSIYTPGTTSYNSMYNNKTRPHVSGYSSRNPETLVFYDTKTDDGRIIRGKDRAAYVLAELQKQIMTATYATVSDYYDLAQVTAGGFTDANFGWRDLSTARIMARDGGYIIALPPTEQVR